MSVFAKYRWISGLLLLLLRQCVSTNFSVGRMMLTGKMLSAADLEHALLKPEKPGQIHFREITRIKSTGYLPLHRRPVIVVRFASFVSSNRIKWLQKMDMELLI